MYLRMTRMDKQRLRKKDYYVADCSLKEVQGMVAEHHYARGGSRTAVYTHGLYEVATDRLIGVAWWLPPTKPAAESVSKEWRRVLSLTRLVCLPEAPQNSCSFLLSRSVKMIKKEGRFVSLVTYADESQGHEGTIYRASNWTYVGKTPPRSRWLDPKTGRQVATKATRNRTNQEMLELGYEKQPAFPKHKFVLHL